MPWDGRRKLVATKCVYGLKKSDPSIVFMKSRTITACGRRRFLREGEDFEEHAEGTHVPDARAGRFHQLVEQNYTPALMRNRCEDERE
jgi:hypothetical protein